MPGQVGNTQTIDVGAAATVDDIRGFVKTTCVNLGLTCDFPAGNSKRAVITGPADGATAFGKIEYRTIQQGPDGWVQNNNLNGPSYVGRALTPSFYVNGIKITP